MTHEYVIALHGRVDTGMAGTAPTAVAWAADHVLAVGSDDAMRGLSRGDSTFLDLGGCVVTPLPDDLASADALVRAGIRQAGADVDLAALLVRAGLLPADAVIETGSPANLAFWDTAGGQRDGSTWSLLAAVRGGAFIEGDEHRGPFPPAEAGGAP
jgi:hypothetical protein